MRKTKNNYVPAEYGGYLFPKSCLPDILPGDRGKVLTVNQNETEAIWAQSGGGLLVHVNLVGDDGIYTSGSLDKTWKEIYDAYLAGVPVSFLYLELIQDTNLYYLAPFIMEEMGYDEGNYYIIFARNATGPSRDFITDSQSGYPSFASD